MTVFRDLAACLAITFLLVGLTISVYAGETLPSGIERIHAQCIWDNNDFNVDMIDSWTIYKNYGKIDP